MPAALTLVTPGTYVVTGTFHVREVGTGDENQWMVGGSQSTAPQ